jgi:SARP family transcriptional regulator, regulator of embCAB operon
MAEFWRPLIQLCGELVLELDGRRREAELPSRQGRMLFAYLVVNRFRPVSRDEAAAAVWPDSPPDSIDRSLSALLSKLRRVLGAEALAGGERVRLALPPGALVDVEAAIEGVHHAEAALARGDLDAAYGPSQVALHVAERGFLPGFNAPWIEDQRRRLDDVLVRALEATAEWGLAAGGSGMATAERAARRLVDLAPFRESGYRLLMTALEASGNLAEALRLFERCREMMRDELGTVPGPDLRAVHRRLLDKGYEEPEERDRALATVVLTDIVRSTEHAAKLGDARWREVLRQHHQLAEREISRFRGRKVKSTGDGVLATFSSPARAVRCALAISAGVEAIGLEVRAGVHSGECEFFGDDVGGIAVHICSRISALARSGEVLVSGTVQDLVAGSGLEFADRGVHTLRGVPGEWRIAAATEAAPGDPAEGTRFDRARDRGGP